MGAIDKKRIAKNTFFLYFRMLIVMGVTVYSARIVLDTLGVNDYGIYTLVGSVVILFTFLNSSMTTCTQRYLCVAIGKENPDYEKDVFTTSVISHILISILFLALSETAGLWLVLNVLNLAPGSKTVALIVYQFAIVTAVFTILRVPFNGAIIAYEKMDFYAYSSIIETALKLVILVPLTWMQTNKLILYSVLVAGVGLIILVWYQIYVFSHLKNCKVTFKEVKVQLMKEMLSFTGWSNFSSLSNLGAKQGMGIILNYFMGVAINAAVGIMNQVTTAVYGFINNFQTALNPPLIKLYVAKDWDNLQTLFVQAAKYSYYLMLLLSLPLIVNMADVLSIWLTEVPAYTGYFCALSLLSLLPNTIGGPIWTIVQASGQIKKYQITIGTVILMNLPMDYLLLKSGMPPYSLLLVALVVNIIVDIIGAGYVRKYAGINGVTMAKGILGPCVIVTVIAYIICYVFDMYVEIDTTRIVSLIVNVAIELLLITAVIVSFGLNRAERKHITSLIKSRI